MCISKSSTTIDTLLSGLLKTSPESMPFDAHFVTFAVLFAIVTNMHNTEAQIFYTDDSWQQHVKSRRRYVWTCLMISEKKTSLRINIIQNAIAVKVKIFVYLNLGIEHVSSSQYISWIFCWLLVYISDGNSIIVVNMKSWFIIQSVNVWLLGSQVFIKPGYRFESSSCSKRTWCRLFKLGPNGQRIFH